MEPDVAAAVEALQEALAHAGRRLTVLYLVYQSGLSELITLPAPAAVPTGTGVRPGGTRRRDAVLAVLARAEKPLKGRALATRAGLRYDSHFRELVGELRREQKVILAPQGGYWLKDRPLPGED